MVDSLSFAYVGTVFCALAEARNYYRWVIRQSTPFIGKQVIEVGAGIGTFARLLLSYTSLSDLGLVEPGENLVPLLQRRFAGEPRVRIVHGYLRCLIAPAIADSTVVVNVPEHIAEDQASLDEAHAALTPGGTLLLLVPALPRLYGSLDQAFGHYRRYTKRVLAKQLHMAGFEIIRLSYLNVLGIAGWFLTGRVLRRTTLQSRYVRWYDQLVIPWLSRLEGRWEPPFGQSLIIIAQKFGTIKGASSQDRKGRQARGQAHIGARREYGRKGYSGPMWWGKRCAHRVG